jgi:hypothetical protein
MDDIERRVREQSAKEMAAGGPDEIIAALVKGYSRLNRVVIFAVIGLVLDISLTVAGFFLVNAVRHIAHRADTNASAIAQIVYTQQVGVYRQCQRSATNTHKINSTDRAFVAFLRGIPPPRTIQSKENLKEFQAIYRRAILKVPDCGPAPTLKK